MTRRDHPQDATGRAERRRNTRVPLRAPLDCRLAGPSGTTLRGRTRNVSAGGIYFETDSPGLHPGARVEIDVTVPAAEGVSVSAGRVATRAEVVRVDPLATPDGATDSRYGVAARFLGKLRLSF